MRTILALILSLVAVKGLVPLPVQFQQRSRPFSSTKAVVDASSEQQEEEREFPVASPNVPQPKKKVAVLVCPAQFCVPDDYLVLFENLKEIESDLSVEILPSSRTVPLSRTDWIKVARQLPTQAFLEAKLDVKTTLQWYFDAIEEGLSQIFAEEGPDVNVVLAGHSIGGWVARAYLGGMSQSSSAVYKRAVEQCSCLITLGTPHISPDEALVDQTRGLLRAIDESPDCHPLTLSEERGISITCVCSQGVGASGFDLERLIAVGSYLPLTGNLNSTGDGIVPISLSYLPEPATRVILNKCSQTGGTIRHSHVVPTPWNLWNGKAPSIPLPEDEYPSYVSKGVVEQWARFIQ